jgi:penicillin-binding protein 2
MFRLLHRTPAVLATALAGFAVGRVFMKTYSGFLYSLLSLIAILPLLNSDILATTTTPPVAPAKKTTPKKKAPVRTSAAVHPAGNPTKPAVSSTSRTSLVKPALATTRAAVTPASRTVTRPRAKRWVQTWDEPTFKDSTDGDAVEGEDLQIRKAAVDALGPYNGSIVVVDPTSGRILSMVNQHLALSGGFQPCSTIKVSVALAALHEGLLKPPSLLRLPSRNHMDLTEAIAHSNNYFFANLGIKMGYDKVSSYAHLFGYGEKAGLNIPDEHPGYFPPKPPANGGMGMLTSFGEEISQTPLELAALISAVANGGTLYWLQYPTSQDQVRGFSPQIKRQLDIQPLIEQIKPGMKGAVEYGTAKRAKQDDTILGKTGTCSQGKTHLGWFGSFNDSGPRKLVVVVLLTGGRPSIGPLAAGVAGDVYRRLAEEKYFVPDNKGTFNPASLISTQICCSK